MHQYPKSLVEHVAETAHAAGDVILSHFRKQVAIELKDDSASASNFATIADLQAEELILERLKAIRPDDIYVAEESTSDKLPAGAYAPGTLIWYIDPLDGTTNFSRGFEGFSVSIAAVDAESGKTVLGVVIAPALGRIYLAHEGRAYMRDQFGEHVLERQVHATARVLNIGFAYERGEQALLAGLMPQLVELYPDIRGVGSTALELCFLAEGRIDAEFQLAVRTWDYMAGQYIAECVGAHVQAPYNPRTGSWSILGATTAEKLQQLKQLLPATD
jgi:myo-inositol-1(or 4)-monophosphatase